MGWLFKKKGNVLDLTERYRKQQEKVAEIKRETQATSNSISPIGIFGMQTSNTNTNSGYTNISSNEDEKKRKLAKRLMTITDKLEELSNQVYHLQQRIELLEKKNEVGY